jgi:hypothetical protein
MIPEEGVVLVLADIWLTSVATTTWTIDAATAEVGHMSTYRTVSGGSPGVRVLYDFQTHVRNQSNEPRWRAHWLVRALASDPPNVHCERAIRFAKRRVPVFEVAGPAALQRAIAVRYSSDAVVDALLPSSDADG